MKKIEFNNIEENKFVMGYIHYKNNKNKIVYKKALGYVVPEENLMFCISSHNLNNSEALEKMMYEKLNDNEKLYVSMTDCNIFEFITYVFPDSNKKISTKVLYELIPLLEKYILDEDFEPDTTLREDYRKDTKHSLKKEVKQLLKSMNV